MMKKASKSLVALMMCLTLLLSSGCVFVDGLIECKGLPQAEKVKMDNGEHYILYNGMKYFCVQEEVDTWQQGWAEEYFLNYNQLLMVASVWTVLAFHGPCKCPIYVSDFDVEQNVLQVRGTGSPMGAWAIYFKEGFEYPSAPFNTPIERIYLCNRGDVAYDKRSYLSNIGAGVTYNSLFERESVTIQYHELDRYRICFLELEGYSYLTMVECSFYVFEYDGNFYMAKEDAMRSFADLKSKETNQTTGYYISGECYRIKEEYQSVFKDAWGQLEDNNNKAYNID